MLSQHQASIQTVGFDWEEDTPAFLLDAGALEQTLGKVQRLRSLPNVRILYSIKALPLLALMEEMLPSIDGFSVSSLFELRLAAELAEPHGHLIHLTSPGLRLDEGREIMKRATSVSFNSLEQGKRFKSIPTQAGLGFRVNPGLSFLDDVRYDPSRPASQLGISLTEFVRAIEGDFESQRGLHFHNMFEGRDLKPLKVTLQHIQQVLGDHFRQLPWMNVGGGYLLNDQRLVEDLERLLVELMDASPAMEILLEPGKGLIGHCGFLITRVVDVFERDGVLTAVLDTGVHHLPEVFEYQKRPSLLGGRVQSSIRALLVGSSCLPGDVFGEYGFQRPPRVDETLIFGSVGAYSMVKASLFNGHNLPKIFRMSKNGSVKALKSYDYAAFRSRWSDASF